MPVRKVQKHMTSVLQRLRGYINCENKQFILVKLWCCTEWQPVAAAALASSRTDRIRLGHVCLYTFHESSPLATSPKWFPLVSSTCGGLFSLTFCSYLAFPDSLYPVSGVKCYLFYLILCYSNTTVHFHF